jgi:hypothetical protein
VRGCKVSLFAHLRRTVQSAFRDLSTQNGESSSTPFAADASWLCEASLERSATELWAPFGRKNRCGFCSNRHLLQVL